jgi:hypothetical protein
MDTASHGGFDNEIFSSTSDKGDTASAILCIVTTL